MQPRVESELRRTKDRAKHFAHLSQLNSVELRCVLTRQGGRTGILQHMYATASQHAHCAGINLLPLVVPANTQIFSSVCQCLAYQRGLCILAQCLLKANPTYVVPCTCSRRSLMGDATFWFHHVVSVFHGSQPHVTVPLLTQKTPRAGLDGRPMTRATERQPRGKAGLPTIHCV